MNKMNRRRALKGIQITVLLVIIGFSALELSHRVRERLSGAAQLANMAAAGRHLPSLLKLLKHNERFDEIVLKEYSGEGGSILVKGTVKSEEELQSLKATVLASNPPVPVLYRVDIMPVELKKQIESYLSHRSDSLISKIYSVPDHYQDLLAVLANDLDYKRTGDPFLAPTKDQKLIEERWPSDSLKTLGLRIRDGYSMTDPHNGFFYFTADTAGHDEFIKLNQSLGISIQEVKDADQSPTEANK